MQQQKIDTSAVRDQDPYVVSDKLFSLFWNRIQAFLNDQFAGNEIPPLMMVLQRPPEGVPVPPSGMEGVPMIIGIADMSVFYNSETKTAGKSAAAEIVKRALAEDETLIVATVNEAWMVSRKAEDISKGPQVLEGAVSDQLDRQEQLMVVLHSRTRQAFSMSPISEQNGTRLIEFQDYEFNNENGTMFSSYFDQPPPYSAMN